MAVATAGAPPIRRERTEEPVAERAPRPNPPEPRPEPLGPARGIALAIAVGALAWAFIIAALLRF
jgi:hypothetical protein